MEGNGTIKWLVGGMPAITVADFGFRLSLSPTLSIKLQPFGLSPMTRTHCSDSDTKFYFYFILSIVTIPWQ